VLAFFGRKLVTADRTSAKRADVAAAYGNFAEFTGFSLTATFSGRVGHQEPRPRVFAIAGQTASELPLSKHAKETVRGAGSQ
jgi:hypothetical protein